MNKRRKILAAMLAAFMLLVPMVSTAQIDIKVGDEETSDLSGTWGTMRITDNETGDYVPLGEGLWLLAGAAGLYLLVKSRKTRKATAVAAAALALTLGTAQCKKTEESVIPAGETISISFMAGNGAKSDIDVTTGRITWEENDEVYVVYDGKLLSNQPLKATPVDQNLVNATISGTITTAVTIGGANPSFTFYYVGSGVDFTPTEASTSLTFDISSQNGIDAGHYMVGRTGAVVMKVKDGTYVPSEGGAKHFDPLTSVLRLNTEAFETNKMMTTMKMSCGNSKMEINLSNATPSYTAGSITFTGGDDVQISVIPTTTAGDVTLYLSGNGKLGNIKVTNGIKAGRIYSKVTNNAGYPIHVETIDGALPGLFSVSGTKKVFFSQGNLQYIGSAATPYWKFADHQFDILGDNGQGNANQYADRDLFGWGTSGYHQEADLSNVNFQPWSTSNSPVSTYNNYYGYGPSVDVTPEGPSGMTQSTGNISGSYYDWGVNCAISNGGGEAGKGKWRTLTGGGGEWNYLFNSRRVKDGKGEGKSYQRATVNSDDRGGVYGMILYPDDYTEQTGAASYTSSEWTEMEAKGCVFLPTAGGRDVTRIFDVGSKGYYWASSSRFPDQSGYHYVHYISFSSNNNVPDGYVQRFYGLSVRLVSDVAPN